MTNPFLESSKYFKTPIQQMMFWDKYSRYNYDLDRRETWFETVDRVVKFLHNHTGEIPGVDYNLIRQYILEMKVMPSMRLLAMAGPAATRQNISIYNCSFMGIDSIKCFGEALMISMSGCGVGFSVERKYTEQLHHLPHILLHVDYTHTVEDSTEGWQAAIDEHIYNLYCGSVIKFDYSQVRPEGAVLKIKGGRSSGPKALKDAIDFITDVFSKAYQRRKTGDYNKLKPIEVHDIMCSIGQCAVSGGTRRTAMISLFDKDDKDMLYSKSGNYNHYRWNANNSAVWDKDLTQREFITQMAHMFDGMNGEPGIFSLEAARNTSPARRNVDLIVGTNPCGEINLRNRQLCNLSAVVAREDDNIDTLKQKVKVATILGTVQSTFTNFPGLRDDWKKNCEDERLLGVDITGQMDCPILVNDVFGLVRDELQGLVINTNKELAEKLNINQSAATSCCKPSGNTSQLVDCSSGMHPRYSKYYIRNIRVSVTSPVYKVLQHHNVPMSPENGQTEYDMTTAVIHFPVKSPNNALLREHLTAKQMLQHWRRNKVWYTEHNPSVTISYKPEEELEIMNWLWENKDIAGGITFLPYSDAKYDNMPYVEITEEEYNKLSSKFPEIDWSMIEQFEQEDMTTAAQEKSCFGGSCELF